MFLSYQALYVAESGMLTASKGTTTTAEGGDCRNSDLAECYPATGSACKEIKFTLEARLPEVGIGLHHK